MTKTRLIFIILFSLMLTFYVSGCRRAGLWIAKKEVPTHADTMILLMGTYPERVLQAADLYHAGIADRLIILSENMGAYRALEERGAKVIRTTEQARDAAVALGIPDSCITILPGNARSTLDEALSVSEYLRSENRIDSLILVSSPAHMRRAHMIFKTVLRKSGFNIYIGCSPSTYSGFNPEKWWKQKEDIQMVLTELIKTGSFLFIEKRKI